MEIIIYDYMIDLAIQIRKEVFVEEQGFIDEFDDIDKICKHVIVYENNEAIGTCRFYQKEKNTYLIGRIAIKKDYRKKHYGSNMLIEVEKYIKENAGEMIVLHAQIQSKSFYEKLGFVASSTVDYEQDCPHVWMKKELDK